MAVREYSSLNSSSAALNMDVNNQQDKKDISKVFNILRNKLNAKEKELLELQRAEPCLLAPDSNQIDSLIDLISSLHLSTQDGSFIFASNTNSNTNSNELSSSTFVSSTGVETIKTLPSNIWLSESTSDKQENQYRLPMVTHLLSLPFNAYVASSSSKSNSSIPSSTIDTNDQPSNRLPMVSQLFSMPINAFKSSSPSSSNNQSTPIQIEDKKETVTKVTSINESSKSILDGESIYSKEHWLKKSSPSESDFITIDIDEYIEQSTDKMRRLHLEYREALEKLKTPSEPIEPSQMIKTMYPQFLDRINSPTLSKDVLQSSSNVKK